MDHTTTMQAQDLRVTGAEIHKFFNFGTIARRVQIGLELAGGVGAVGGQVVATRLRSQMMTASGSSQLVGVTTVDTLPGSEFFAESVNYIPLARLELGVGVIATPSFKVRVAGGFNSPAIQLVSVRAIYFFGAK